MQPLHLVTPVIAGLVLTSCEQEGPSAAEVARDAATLCDGTAHLRYLARSPSIERRAGGEMMALENGVYFAVDGQCRFFLYATKPDYDPQRPSPLELRTGMLRPEDAARLVVGSHYREWQQLGGVIWASRAAVHHPQPFEWSDGKNVVRCWEDCAGRDVPAAVARMRQHFEGLTRVYWDRGTPWTGPVRAALFAWTSSVKVARAAPYTETWPIGEVGPFVADRWDMVPGGGRAVLVTAPDDVAALRRMWTAFARGEKGMEWWRDMRSVPIKARESDPNYDFLLYVRDAAPFEDEKGVLAATWD